MKIKLLTISVALAVLSGCSSNGINKGDFKIPWGDSNDGSIVIKDEVAIETVTEEEVGIALNEILTEDGYVLTINDITDPERDWVLENNTIYFGFDSDKFDTVYQNIINRQFEFLKNQNIKVILEGHTDERGANTYNTALGERRAKTIKNILLEKGLSEEQVEIISYGELKPVSMGGSEAEWAKDRRVVFKYK